MFVPQSSGSLSLTAGNHAVEVLYFQAEGAGYKMKLYWASTTFITEQIPFSSFTSMSSAHSTFPFVTWTAHD